jgi:hypothetical protein
MIVFAQPLSFPASALKPCWLKRAVCSVNPEAPRLADDSWSFTREAPSLAADFPVLSVEAKRAGDEMKRLIVDTPGVTVESQTLSRQIRNPIICSHLMPNRFFLTNP